MSETVIRLRISGLGHAPAFKNSKRIIKIKGHPAITAKQAHKAWMAHAMLQLRQQCKALQLPPRLTEKRPPCRIKDRMKRLAHERNLAVSIAVTIGVADLDSADLDGVQATITDCLVRSRALADDSPRYVKSSAISWQPVHPGYEFAQIVITLN